MKVYVYSTGLGIPHLFRDLDEAKEYVGGDVALDESECPEWMQREDEILLHVKGRFSRVATIWERFI